MLLSDKYPFLTNYFTQALSSSHNILPQCLLFYGNDLEAQYLLSKEISRMLNCKGDKSDDCNCLNCKWIRDDAHPAVKIISKLDNKPEDDDSKTVISIKQAQMIKESLVISSEFHRVFIFCDRDENGKILGLNPLNFQEETANSLLKIIEEPLCNVTFIFLTRYTDDVLATIKSRSQCFFVPSGSVPVYNYDNIINIFENYFEFERKDVFDISQQLQDLSKTIPVVQILDEIQNYILVLLKSNPKNVQLIKHIEYIEKAKSQAKFGFKSANIFDEVCLNLIH